jgi:hypothetical protein
VRDLLAPGGGELRIRNDPKKGFFVEGLSANAVADYASISQLMEAGARARTVASTQMNATSSRAHTIFQIVLTQTRVDRAAGTAKDKVSVINLIDLAGSERADSTGASGDRLREGAQLTLIGTTPDNFIEVKLADGRFGYLADAPSILARLGGKPIAIAFNPQTCAFSGEIGAEFAKLSGQLRTQWQALEAKEFASESARQKAFAAVEGKSKYLRLRRSFEGLSLTGIAQHYESQSLYFDDPPAKVVEVFRAQGFDIGRDGQFTGTDLYAGIAATQGEGAAYGKTELGCGV